MKSDSIGSLNYRFRLSYETLRSLLNKNNRSLQLLCNLEADLNHLRYSSDLVKRPVLQLLEEVLLMAQECNMLTDQRHRDLYDVILRIMGDVQGLFHRDKVVENDPLAVPLDSEKALDPALVGGKAAGLAALGRMLEGSVLPGFVLTTAAYDALLGANRLHERIRLLLKDIEVALFQESFKTRTETIRNWILQSEIPGELKEALHEQAAPVKCVGPTGWAVRSSCVFEDGRNSFAGLFESELRIPTEELPAAYLRVVASRFLDRAMAYRIHRGIREVDTPMAVLFVPMIEPAASGVIWTAEPGDPRTDVMFINVVRGLGDQVTQGTTRANGFRLSREAEPEILETLPASEQGEGDEQPGDLEEFLPRVAALAYRARERAGYDMDMEWAIDGDGRIRFLQARRIIPQEPRVKKPSGQSKDLPLIEGGFTIFPGRAEGIVIHLSPSDDLQTVPKGSVVLVDQPRPALAPLLPRIAALLAVEGNPAGHLATLTREFSVPSLFRIGAAAGRLVSGNVISVDATTRRIYRGSRWPGMRERVLARISMEERPSRSGPLYDLILALNLTDPDSSSFKAKGCRSIHDAIRFMHEMSVRSMFSFGDRQKKEWKRRSIMLKTDLKVQIHLIHLDRPSPPTGRSLSPEEIESTPFQAFWRGFADKSLPWPRRWEKEMLGLPRDFQETVLGGHRGPRRASDANYIMVAGDYLNFNARFTYHYAMVDAIVGPGAENNHVYFTSRGGGASKENRVRRAIFIERVLRRSRFEVDRRGEMVTAWLRRYPESDSRQMLERLGRLLVCCRELDAVLKTDSQVKLYADLFLQEQYQVFA